MSITLVAIALIAIGNIFYAYRCIVGTRAFIDQYGMGDGSAFMIKLAGTFCAGLGFMLVYVLLTGIEGTWELFTFGFVQAALLTVVGYQTVNGPWAEVESEGDQGRLYRACRVRHPECRCSVHRRRAALRLDLPTRGFRTTRKPLFMLPICQSPQDAYCS